MYNMCTYIEKRLRYHDSRTTDGNFGPTTLLYPYVTTFSIVLSLYEAPSAVGLTGSHLQNTCIIGRCTCNVHRMNVAILEIKSKESESWERDSRLETSTQ